LDKRSIMDNLAEKRVLIAGGSGGIGGALSRFFAKQKAHVIVQGKSSNASRLVKNIVTKGGSAESWEYDFDTPDALGNFEKLLRKHLPIDILVLAYGPLLSLTLPDMNAQDWEHIVLHNLSLPGILLSVCVSGMAQRRWGRVFLFGGTQVQSKGYRDIVGYEAAKAGISVLIKSVARTFAAQGVAAYGFYPNYVDTEYVSAAQKDQWKHNSRYGRILNKEDIVDTVSWVLKAPVHVINGVLFSLRPWGIKEMGE